jgi:Domain of unknown function (DUF6089)
MNRVKQTIHFFLPGFLNLFLYTNAISQAPEFSIFGGMSNYLGDLTQKPLVLKNAGKVLGVNFKFPINDKFWLRASVAQGSIAGYDKDNDVDLQPRNLSFQTNLTDGFLAVEYRVFSPDRHALTPYIFVGGGAFHFNPYVNFGDKNEKVFLQPLGTEGQGLPEYPDRQMYKLTQFFVPVGGGLLWTINEKWLLGIEFRNSFTFTDYLDDVSNRYALPEPLLRDRGPLAVELAWRRDEYDGRPYGNNEGRRGNPNNDDWFYYLGLHAGFKLNNGSANSSFKKSKNQLGCPRW